jgi:hypothetical protein
MLRRIAAIFHSTPLDSFEDKMLIRRGGVGGWGGVGGGVTEPEECQMTILGISGWLLRSLLLYFLSFILFYYVYIIKGKGSLDNFFCKNFCTFTDVFILFLGCLVEQKIKYKNFGCFFSKHLVIPKCDPKTVN